MRSDTFAERTQINECENTLFCINSREDNISMVNLLSSSTSHNEVDSDFQGSTVQSNKCSFTNECSNGGSNSYQVTLLENAKLTSSTDQSINQDNGCEDAFCNNGGSNSNNNVVSGDAEVRSESDQSNEHDEDLVNHPIDITTTKR